MNNIKIEDIPVYYISFFKNKECENNLKKFGFNNIYMYEAIDGKKLDIDTMAKEKLISIRSYDDLNTKTRYQHSGMPSIGAIGCSLSHYDLWNKCIDNNYPYMVICEDDNCILNFNNNIKNDIKNAIYNDGLYISADVSKPWMGSHMYIISREACKQLVKYFYPIDVQVDFYINHVFKLFKLNLHGEAFSIQKRVGNSSIQLSNISCQYFEHNNPYKVSTIILGVLLGCLIIIFIFTIVKYVYNKHDIV